MPSNAWRSFRSVFWLQSIALLSLDGYEAASSKDVEVMQPPKYSNPLFERLMAWADFFDSSQITNEDDLPDPDSESPESLVFDAILSQRPGSVRHFVVDLQIHEDEDTQSFPVVFDTGSTHAWLMSDELASSMKPPLVGFNQSGDDVKAVGGYPRAISYVTSQTKCNGWFQETLTLSNSTLGWDSVLCVSDETDVGLRAASGVLGADLVSAFSKASGEFTLVPIEYPKVGLILRESVAPSALCRDEMVYSDLSVFGANWMVASTIGIQGFSPVQVSARMDTGVHRIYLPRLLWQQFSSAVKKAGIRMGRSAESADYKSTDCHLIHLLPNINLSLDQFEFELKPTEYTELRPERKDCVFHVYDFDSRSEALIGAPFLTRVVSRWNQRKRKIGFCNPI